MSADDTRGWSGGQASLLRVTVALAGLLGVGVALILSDHAGRTLAEVEGLITTVGAEHQTPWHGDLRRLLIDVGLLLSPLAFLGLALGMASRICGGWVLGAAVLALGAAATPPLGPIALMFSVVLLGVLPQDPLLSWPARGRADPRGEWRWLPRVASAARLMVVVVDAALVSRLLWGSVSPAVMIAARKGAETSAVGRGLGELAWVLGGSPSIEHSLAVGLAWLPSLLALHLFAWSPRRIAGRDLGARPLLLFDGDCALCHGTVRFLLAEDVAGVIEVAPLQGETAAARLSPEQRASLPDSLVLLTEDGRLRTRSDAVLAVLGACGGLWRVVAVLLALVPRPLRDAGYAFVAAVRLRVFGRAKNACPLLPADLAARLLP